MSRDEIGTKIQGAVDYLTANPAEARYTDSPATARLTDPGGLQVTVEGPDGASLATDMPTSVGGANSAASPGWFLRAAAAACVATLIGMRAAHVGVELDSVEVTVDSESDDRGILGIDDTVPAGPLSTRVAIRVVIHFRRPRSRRRSLSLGGRSLSGDRRAASGSAADRRGGVVRSG